MNISVDLLRELRKELDTAYDKAEKEINEKYAKRNLDNIQKIIDTQDLIDKQLDLLDTIIYNLENTPKLYDELMKMNNEYKQVVGE